MATGEFDHRLARLDDVPAMREVMERAITELQRPFLTEAEIEASRAIMGLDTQLIEDGTYFVVLDSNVIAGCGGWSRRATLFGSDTTEGRDARLVDPAREPARIRAMYTDPSYARRGIGRTILSLCETAARAEGFSALELMATLSGAELYKAAGYEPVEHLTDARGRAAVPLVKMRKAIAGGQASNSASQ